MKVSGAELVVRALEAEGVRFTFGIPGTHNIELYDALDSSETIEPILVTDEQSAAFMADAVSRTTDGVGVVNVVPGAGVTHCLSGVAEAFMDNIPLVVLTAGRRSDTGKAYQLHDIDQLSVLRPVCKEVFSVGEAKDIYPTVRRAFALARGGTPGPVAVEIPVNLYLGSWPVFEKLPDPPPAEVPRALEAELARVAGMIDQAGFPALYIGNGAASASDLLPSLAEKLGAPVATSMQGKGVFDETHPLWLWNGFGAATPAPLRAIMERCDCLLAVGCRFSETATASYGFEPPDNLIHVDINPEVFGKNYPTRYSVQSDARLFLEGLIDRLKVFRDSTDLKKEIAEGHHQASTKLRRKSSGRVSPGALFGALQDLLPEDAIYTTDSGKGTFLAVEHLRLTRPGCFLSPVDFSCMGYAVPAAIGAKFANPQRDVVALEGDGALLMTGLELLTAGSHQVAPLVCVLRDGELGQIVSLQRTSFNRDTCSILPPYEVEHFARLTHCEYAKVETDADLEKLLPGALQITRSGQPVMLDIHIDYSRMTYFTKGVITTNFWRLSWPERLRMSARVVGRRLRPK